MAQNFLVKFEEIQAKILRTPKNLPAPAPTPQSLLRSEKIVSNIK